MRFTHFMLCLTLLVPTAPAWAGIVVFKNGKVVVGKIKPEEIDQEKIIVRWPYKDTKAPEGEEGRGVLEIPRYRVRWYNADLDELPDTYFEKYADQKLADEWQGALRKWQLRQENSQELPGELSADQAAQDSAALITKPDEEQPKETPAETPKETPKPAVKKTPAPAASPAQDSGILGGLCSLQPQGQSSGAAAWLALLGLGLLALRRR